VKKEVYDNLVSSPLVARISSSGGKGGEMTQILYAHINKRKNKFKKELAIDMDKMLVTEVMTKFKFFIIILS
jgi:hypothetical protein